MPVRGKDGSYYDSVDEVMRANTQWEQREKQNKLLEEQNRIAQQRFQMEQQQLQMQQQAIEQQQETERQRRIAENNAEIERLTNILREHCRAIGISYDYLMDFYNKLYKDKEKNEDIIQKEIEIEELKELKEYASLNKKMEPIAKKGMRRLIKITIIIFAVFLLGMPIVGYLFNNKYISMEICLAIVFGTTIIIPIILIKSAMNMGLGSGKENEMLAHEIVKIKNIKMKYKIRNFQTQEYYNSQISELQEKLNSQIEQANSNSRKIQEEFDEFRRNHYNKELELLFKDLEIGFNKIAPSEAKGEGTITEYDEYIKNKILEN